MLNVLKENLYNNYKLKNIKNIYGTQYSYVSNKAIERLYTIIQDECCKGDMREQIKKVMYIRPINLKTFHPDKNGILGIEIDISDAKYCWIVPLNEELDKFIVYINAMLIFDKNKGGFINREDCIFYLDDFISELDSLGYLDAENSSTDRYYKKSLEALDKSAAYLNFGNLRAFKNYVKEAYDYLNRTRINDSSITIKTKSNIEYMKFRVYGMKNEGYTNVVKEKIKSSLRINPFNQLAIREFLKNTIIDLREIVIEKAEKENFYEKIDYSENLELLNKVLPNLEKRYIINIFSEISDSDNNIFARNLRMFTKETIQLLIKTYEYIGDVVGENDLYFLNILIGLYKSSEENLYTGYVYFKKHINNWKELLALYGNDFVDICISLEKYDEAEVYINDTLIVIDSVKESLYLEEDISNIKLELKNKLAIVYQQQNRLEEAENQLREIVEIKPNNTIYHNLGVVLMKRKKYQLAKEYLMKALLISQDETGYLVMANTLYFNGEYRSAIEYYKKAIAFIESTDTTFIFNELNNKKVLSTIEESHLLSMKKDAYENIIHSYIELEDYINSIAYYKVAIEEFEFEERFIRLEKILSRLISYEENSIEISRTLDKAINDLENEKKLASKQLGKVREWALSLIKVQNKSSLLSENDETIEWSNFEDELQNIAEKMKESELESLEVSFTEIESSLISKYPNMSKKALKFLTTGEYLYRINENQYVDYAPIMIEYCKVVELELNNYLKNKGVIQDEKMLGYINKIIQNSNMYDVKKYLSDIVKYRNESAHTGSVDREKVEYIREILFEKDFLNLLLI
ncbi:tetratricopeptide repeat protein [Clostridium perfringens]|uniref:tetratricopeptide repeat protein n=1 Tax=Clostridium perfringens TaxID=1502 RepID=UPI0018E4D5DE|nr:tetratricopeptide repeat protein [Clostridium perfringens]MBI6107131.1 tetratricopeptide repeat protein [Clostridium perfringens]